MNIFILDESPILSAKWQHDRHIVKMILESAQLLSTACKTDGAIIESFERSKIPWGDKLYKVTHANHPCALWARESKANFVWLTIHMHALLQEYSHRFPGRHHACWEIFWDFAAFCGSMIGSGFVTRNDRKESVPSFAALTVGAKHTPFVYCGPRYSLDESDFESNMYFVTETYRHYYVQEKCAHNRWTNPSVKLPDWLKPYALIRIAPRHDNKIRGYETSHVIFDELPRAPLQFGVKPKS